jgi:hypothetical protein
MALYRLGRKQYLLPYTHQIRYIYLQVDFALTSEIYMMSFYYYFVMLYLNGYLVYNVILFIMYKLHIFR